ncbi:MAG: LbtU family siderophore porin [Gammaproteobacteria bacterium]|nr:LbtU family siderophore porin [Gammaproteobacteria bacterium]MCH9744610.1 LbtU family siderophore porin [Gammaproteobacteria bacterium]
MKQYLLPALGIGLLFSSASVLAASSEASTAKIQAEVRDLSVQTKALRKEVRALRKSPTARARGGRGGQRAQAPFGHAVTVTTSPWVGLKSNYNATDVLSQASSMNEDLTLLQQHQQVDQYLRKHGYSTLRPIVEISGGLEGQIYNASGFGVNNETDKGVALSNAELDLNALVSSWASGFLSFSYSNAPTSSGDRQPVDTLYLKRGFITIGNLQRFPVYFTIGQTYVPFGKFSSLMISTPLTQSVARVSDTAAILGIYKNGFYGQVYTYPGDRTTDSDTIFNQAGLNAGYERTLRNGKFDMGAGWISNIADSQGMQATGLAASNTSQFRGFGATVTGNALVHDVGAFDAHAEWAHRAITLVGEFVTTVRKFDSADLSFNGAGANVKALHLEADYAFNKWGKPFTAGVSYGHSWEALALNLPEDSYTADLQVSLWKNTLETLEYRHDTDFSGFATGRGATTNITGNGGSRNAVTLQVGAYF